MRVLQFIIALVSLTGCIYEGNIEYFSRLASSRGGAVEDRFYIRLNTEAYQQLGREPILHELSTTDEIGLEDCGVDKSADSIEDIYCTLDINEMDLLNTEGSIGISLKYNVPRGMCEYTSFYAPWHWNQPVGFGPKCLIKDENTKGSGDDKTTEIEYCQVGVGVCASATKATNPTSATKASCSSNIWVSLTEDKNLSQQFCGILDLSDGERGLSNCCFGEYTVVGIGDSNKNSIEQASWGGSVQDCIGGPLRVSGWEKFSPDKTLSTPLPRIAPSWDKGLNEDFEIPPTLIVDPFSRTTGNLSIHPEYSSIHTSTYYKGIEDFQWNAEDGCSDCPQFFKSIDTLLDNGKSLDLLGYPYFTLECLDSNMEALHRVHLTIREWNTLEEFFAYQDSSGRSGDPDVTGREGEECNYYIPDEFGNTDCNNLTDLDDIIERGRNPDSFSKAGIDLDTEGSSILAILRQYPYVIYDGGGN